MTEWSGYPDPHDPANFWIDDDTGERVNAHTGERMPRLIAKSVIGDVCQHCGRDYGGYPLGADEECMDDCPSHPTSPENRGEARP